DPGGREAPTSFGGRNPHRPTQHRADEDDCAELAATARRQHRRFPVPGEGVPVREGVYQDLIDDNKGREPSGKRCWLFLMICICYMRFFRAPTADRTCLVLVWSSMVCRMNAGVRGPHTPFRSQIPSFL